MTTFRFDARGTTYKVTLLDDPEMATDPALLVFRGVEEEPLVAIHLEKGCEDHGSLFPGDPYSPHITVRPPEED